jgi:hypothetical protein
VWLDLEALASETAAELREAAASNAPSDRLDLHEFHDGGADGYQRARPFPEDIEGLRSELGIDSDPRWWWVDVDSVVIRGTRRVVFPAEVALDAALGTLDAVPAAGNTGVHYPVGTTFLAEERGADGVVHETHVSRKRADQDWDYALYDHDGVRRTHSPAMPQRFRVPTTCSGCHNSSLRLPPFRDFPDVAPPIGGFQPIVRMELDAEEAALVRRLDGTAAAHDRVLGRYAGVVAVRLQRKAAAGELSGWEPAAWARLRLALDLH